MKKHILLAFSAVILLLLGSSSCGRQDDELLIMEAPIDGPFCIKNLKEDTLYRIHNQSDMDTLFEGYTYPLPQLDFSKQSMFLIWGYSYGEVYNKEVSFTNLRFAAAKINKKRIHQTDLKMERKREVDNKSRYALINSGRADCAWSVAESAICSKRPPSATSHIPCKFYLCGLLSQII